MKITPQDFDDCANRKNSDRDLKTLIGNHGLDAEIRYQLIDTPEAAAEKGFRGSPTVLIDGVDPFADSNAPIALTCRVYRTEAGFAGSPTRDQLEEAITPNRTALRVPA